MLGLSFLFVYLRTREHWWPIIPSGALFSIAGIIMVTAQNHNPEPAWIMLILFGGLALTFLLLTILPSKAGRAKWAIWPAGGLLIPAFFAGAGTFGFLNYLLPAVLILAGGYILYRSFR